MNTTETKPVPRCEVLRKIREAGGRSEEVEILTDHIEDFWETLDLLRGTLGKERTQEIINASTPLPYYSSNV